MKLLFLSTLAAIMLAACNSPKTIPEQYINAFNKRSLSNIKALLADTIVLIETEYTAQIPKDKYIDIVGWQWEFGAKLLIDSIRYAYDQQVIYYRQDSKRIIFLNKAPLAQKVAFEITDNKITAMRIEYLNFDMPTWKAQRTAFVQWLSVHHPDRTDLLNRQTAEDGRLLRETIEEFEAAN